MNLVFSNMAFMETKSRTRSNNIFDKINSKKMNRKMQAQVFYLMIVNHIYIYIRISRIIKSMKQIAIMK